MESADGGEIWQIFLDFIKISVNVLQISDSPHPAPKSSSQCLLITDLNCLLKRNSNYRIRASTAPAKDVIVSFLLNNSFLAMPLMFAIIIQKECSSISERFTWKPHSSKGRKAERYIQLFPIVSSWKMGIVMLITINFAFKSLNAFFIVFLVFLSFPLFLEFSVYFLHF